MTEGQPHFFREWRLHLGVTLEQLAEKIGMSHQNLGKIERFKVPYSEHVLGGLEAALGVDRGTLISEPPPEPDKPPTHYVAAWRAFRGWTVRELAARSGIAESDIRELEAGSLPLTGRRAVALGAALEVAPGRLREVDPTDIDPEVLEAWDAIPKERRAEARQILKVLSRAGG